MKSLIICMDNPMENVIQRAESGTAWGVLEDRLSLTALSVLSGMC